MQPLLWWLRPRRDGFAVLVRVKTQFGDFHLEIPVDQKEPTLALREARKTLYQFVTKELTAAADFPLKFE
jgi:hypothetical protein